MCGIFGNYNLQADRQQVHRMLFHRGPDSQHSHAFSNGLEFHHTRLSVVDIQGGHQPLHLGPYSIIFNGEIYNHQELRSRFSLKGKTNSDTETLLLLYEKYGSEMLQHLDGMFAFAIYDNSNDVLFLARDRAGKKPLYFYNLNGQFAFSSELNTIQKVVNDEVDNARIARYTQRGFFFKEQTPYKNIHELLPGHIAWYTPSSGDFKTHQWWDISKFYNEKTEASYAEAKEEVSQRLEISVKRRLLSSDLEVGAFLSGGIDSGLVTAMASKYTEKLKTFTVSFEGQFDESSLAQTVADHFKTDHHRIDISFDDLNDKIDKIFASYGEPVMDDSIIPSYYVSKAAKEHVTVILNGDGGDEIFGGYRRYVPFQLTNLLKERKIPETLLKNQNNSQRRSKLAFLKRIMSVAALPPAEAYLASTTDISMFNVNQAQQDDYDLWINEVLQKPWHPVDQMLYLDFQTILPSILLKKMDIATMKCSLEGRSPFLGVELLEYAPKLPVSYKVRGFKTKKILRDLTKNLLPQEIHHQPKRGFEIPLEEWVEQNFKERIQEIVENNNSFIYNFFDDKEVKELFTESSGFSKYRRAKFLFMIMGLESWHQNISKW